MRTTALMLWDHPFDRVIPRWLGRVDIPTLSSGATTTGCSRPRWRRRGPALLPDATVKTFPDAGHLVLDESPEAAEAVAQFCAR